MVSFMSHVFYHNFKNILSGQEKRNSLSLFLSKVKKPKLDLQSSLGSELFQHVALLYPE